MTRPEAARIMAALMAAFRQDLADDTQEMWYSSALERCPKDEAGRVLARVIATEEWFPTPAVWNRHRRELALGERAQHRELDAVIEPPVNEDARKALTGALKELFSIERKHDHHRGWENCPTCSRAGATERDAAALVAKHRAALA